MGLFLTSSRNLVHTFHSNTGKAITKGTIDTYISYLEDAFLVAKACRFDVKERRYIGSPVKYYFEDIGVRNAVTGFRQLEETHVMENFIYNQLRMLGYQVDVGGVSIPVKNGQGNYVAKRTEVDFVVNKADCRLYIQSALRMETREKTLQEEASFLHIPDMFRKIIIVSGSSKPWYTPEGVLVVGLLDFLLEPETINH